MALENVLFSVLILNKRNVPAPKRLAATAVSAVTPGPLGLLVPLLVARNAATTDGNGDGDISTLVRVPDVLSLDEPTARGLLAKSSLVPGTVTHAFIADVEAGKVGLQSPRADDLVETGSKVNLLISDGADTGATDSEPVLERKILEQQGVLLQQTGQILSKLEQGYSSTKVSVPEKRQGAGA